MQEEIRIVDESESKSWNDFVLACENSSFSHLYEWSFILKESYGFTPIYLAAYLENKISSLLPLMIVKKPFKKKIGISLPHLPHAGYLKCEYHRECSIIDYLNKLIERKKINSIEIRQKLNHTVIDTTECTMVMYLQEGLENVWNNFKPRLRNKIRNSEKHKITKLFGNNQIHEFYEVYSRNMHLLGTPNHSKNFFINIVKWLGDRINILVLYFDGQPIATMILMNYKSSMVNLWTASLIEYRELLPNYLLYWEAIRYACQNNFKEFDFGRSHLNSGTYNFKQQWGAKPIAIKNEVISFYSKDQKPTIEGYRSNKARMFTYIWSKVPYKVSILLGPWLRKFIP